MMESENQFFFFKQKTAYEVLRSLVGSEMCIRDSPTAAKAPSTARVLEDICPVCRLAMTAANARALSLSLIHI